MRSTRHWANGWARQRQTHREKCGSISLINFETFSYLKWGDATHESYHCWNVLCWHSFGFIDENELVCPATKTNVCTLRFMLIHQLWRRAHPWRMTMVKECHRMGIWIEAFTKSGNGPVIAVGDIKSLPLQQKHGERDATISCVRCCKGIRIHLIFCMHLFSHYIIEEVAWRPFRNTAAHTLITFCFRWFVYQQFSYFSKCYTNFFLHWPSLSRML